MNPERVFAEDLVGAILDVTYLEPRCIYRVRVTRFCPRTGWHTVDSKGLSSWEGEAFKDTIDVNQMFADDQIVLVQEGNGTKASKLGRGGVKRQRSQSPGGRGPAKGSKAVSQAHPAGLDDMGTPMDCISHSRGRSGAAISADKDEHEFPLGANLCGRVVDITYTDPPETFRVRVVSFDKRTGWHKIDSSGLSLWEDDSFRDTVDIVAMKKAGHVRLVPEEDLPSGLRQATLRPQGKRGRARPRGSTGVLSGVDSGGHSRGRAGRNSASGKSGGLGAGIKVVPPGGNGRMVNEGPSPPASRQPTPSGEELVSRIIDVSLPHEPNGKRGPHRLCVVGYDRITGRHIVEPSGVELEDPNGPRSLDLQELIGLGLVELVDGQDELLMHSHALVGERIRFLPSETDGGDGDGSWLAATVIGWWPQDILPPVATQWSAEGPRGAVFVAEDTDGDRWQLSLGDAILAMVDMPSPRPSRRGARVLEVFAGSCALSIAFWRLGVEAEMYDIRLNGRHVFQDDNVLLKQLAAPDIDLVHLSPPESIVQDRAAMAQLLWALQTVHGRGGCFVIECGSKSGLWNTSEMQQVASIQGTEPLSVDLQDFGASRPAPTRLLTNCSGWLEPALAAGLSAAGGAAERPEAADGDRSEPHPRAFVDAYAKGAVQALGL